MNQCKKKYTKNLENILRATLASWKKEKYTVINSEKYNV